MALYEIGVRTTSLLTTTASLEIRPNARRFRLVELQIVLAAATASTFGLGRPATAGVGADVAFLDPYAVNPAAKTMVWLSWTTAPTAPAAFFRRWSLPATVGHTVTYRPDALWNPSTTGNTLVLWNLTAVGACDVNIVIDEE